MTTLAIIGAGPGGLYAAREAAALGLKVSVFEKHRVGERINCAEGFFDLLQLLDPPAHETCRRIKELEIEMKDKFLVDCSAMNLWMIDRTLWQKSLAGEVQRAGCLIYENHPVSAQDINKLKKQFDWVIQAGGVKNYPLNTGGQLAYTAQYTMEGDFSRQAGRIRIVIEPHHIGYYWIFPKSPRVANVGIGRFAKKPGPVATLGEELQRVIVKEGLADNKILKKSGGPIPVARASVLVEDNMMLVGDAAGLASPLHGGGIDTACISGILAARAAAAGNPAQYMVKIRQILAARLQMEQAVLKAWRDLPFEEVNDLLAMALGAGPVRLSGLWKHRRLLAKEIAFIRNFTRGRTAMNRLSLYS